jgi:hypothetical protein
MLSRSQALALVLTLPAVGTAVLGAQLGCEQDEVLPNRAVTSMCGDGVVGPGEQCDTTSPGCVNCQISPEWTCPNNMCSVNCDDPGVVAAGGSCARTEACNMTGYWAVRETDYTNPSGMCSPQMVTTQCEMSTQWYLYHVTQAPGASRYSIDTALDCGIHVTGLATVDYTPDTEAYLMYRSGIDVDVDGSRHAPRQGTAEEISGGCHMSLDRFFFIRGATNVPYLPASYDNDASLPPAVTASWLGAPPLPAQPPNIQDNIAYATNIPDGSINTNGVGDGGVVYPGAAFAISGTLNGIRHSAQRDYKGYAATSPIASSALSFTFPGNYSLQESVLSVTNCTVKGSTVLCGILAAVADPALEVPPSVTFSFIGTSLTSTRTASVIVGVPKKVYVDDLATCSNIRLILPHDGSIQDGSGASDAGP